MWPGNDSEGVEDGVSVVDLESKVSGWRRKNLSSVYGQLGCRLVRRGGSWEVGYVDGRVGVQWVL